MGKMLVGPVIGKLTDTTVRVLIEVDKNQEVTCNAADSKGKKIQQKKSFRKYQPSVFTLQGLKPDTNYTITFSGVTNAREGKIKTFPKQPHRMNIAAVSCNFTIRRGDTNLWQDMLDRYINTGELDVVFHLGDQIYGDNTFEEALYILNGKSKGSKIKEGAILEAYRTLYRMTWNDEATQKVLASVPNLMIWDDHEIRDDWGSRETDYDKKSVEYYIGTLARQVFREYQRQLWDDLDAVTSGYEHHLHSWGPIGAIFVDQRGGRSFERESARPYLGTGQWNDISAALSEGGKFASVRALIVATSVPLVYLGGNITTIGGNISLDTLDDLQDHWSYEPHRKEQIEMIRLLRTWKEKGKEGEREVLVLGGDVHVGGHTKIKHEGKTIFRQLITSPITNRPPRSYEFLGIQAFLESEESLGGSYSFEHQDFTKNRNFGMAIVRVPTATSVEQKVKIDGTLVKAV